MFDENGAYMEQEGSENQMFETGGRKRSRAAATAAEQVRRKANEAAGLLAIEEELSDTKDKDNSNSEEVEYFKENAPMAKRTQLEKPNVSFSVLIKEAILNSPKKRLLLNEIYDAIAKTHPYFRTAGEGWKNSVRHNLSINSMFCKVPRDVIEGVEGTGGQLAEDVVETASKTTKKKGCYWILRDLTSLGQAGPNPIEMQRRKSLTSLRPSTLFSQYSKQQGTQLLKPLPISPRKSSGDELVQVKPWVSVPLMVDVGRRFSDTFLGSEMAPKKPVSLQELRQDQKEKLKKLQTGRRTQSLYGTATESAKVPSIKIDDGAFFNLQPLTIEEAEFEDHGFEWWNMAAGPIKEGGLAVPRMGHRKSKDDSVIDITYTFQSELPAPPIYVHPAVVVEPPPPILISPPDKTTTAAADDPYFMFPRRNIGDIWLGEGAKSPVLPPQGSSQS